MAGDSEISIDTATEKKYYNLFINALSYTLVFNSVQEIADSKTTDLFFITAIVAAGVFLLMFAKLSWDRTRQEKGTERFKNLWDAIDFFLEILVNINVQLLSTMVARWVLSLPPDDIEAEDVIPTGALCLVLIWLLARSLGIN